MSVVKFQYIPSGQGGGGGWARLSGDEASSISGRIANTTADTALRCSQGFIGHLFSVAFWVEILGMMPCLGVRIAQTVGNDGIAQDRQPRNRAVGWSAWVALGITQASTVRSNAVAVVASKASQSLICISAFELSASSLRSARADPRPFKAESLRPLVRGLIV